MLEKYSRYSEVINKFPAKLILIGVVVVGAVLALKPKEAKALTAKEFLDNFSGREQAAFVSGAVGAYAHARYLREKPDKTGMNCIYDWYFKADAKNKWAKIETWFERHPDYPVEPLLYVLIKKGCGA
ncbi:MAG: hypothetical protein AAF542_07380 [Pseudomonadota bacterium]